MAEGKELALGVGVTLMTRDEVKKINDGKALMLGHALDGACVACSSFCSL